MPRSLLALALATAVAATPAVAAGGGPYVPEWIRPGARLVYYGGARTVAENPGQKGSAGVGLNLTEVVAVLPDRVLMSTDVYLGGQAPGVYTFGGSLSQVATASTVEGNGALWNDPAALKAASSGGGVEVTRGPWVIEGTGHDSVSFRILSGDSASQTVFDQGTGLLLSQLTATGRKLSDTSPYDRAITSQSEFRGQRRMEALLGPAPAWVATFRGLTYSKTYAMPMPGVALPPVTGAVDYTVTEQGPDWAILTRSEVVHGSGSPPSTSTTVDGPGTRFGLWQSPEVLARLAPGVVDRDDLLRATLTYAVQSGPLGTLGVLSETNDAGTYVLTAGYRLDDGVLAWSQLVQRNPDVVSTYSLVGRR